MTPEQPKRHIEKWFVNRIKKVIYRHSKKNIGIGFRIIDKAHANYLFISQNELNLFYYA